MTPHFDEPYPREVFGEWKPRRFDIKATIPLSSGVGVKSPSITDVLSVRTSQVPSRQLQHDELGKLLWLTCRVTNSSGCSGLQRNRRPGPSAGALHGYHVLVHGIQDLPGIYVYDPFMHKLGLLETSVDSEREFEAAWKALGLEGAGTGTLAMFAFDMAKYDAKYENAASLVYRDAGVLVSMFSLVATSLNLVQCPIGWLGNSLIWSLGLDKDRFCGGGGVALGHSAL